MSAREQNERALLSGDDSQCPRAAAELLSFVFIRTYGGFTNDRIDDEERDRLMAALTDNERQTVQQYRPDGSYYCAGYDPPLKLFFRRNEIWLAISPAAEPRPSIE